MYLFVNTANSQSMTLSLLNQKGKVLNLKKIKSEYQQSEKLLANISLLLTKTKIKLSNLKGIIVINGPGGFTSLRIGIATANTLAWSLNIPIVGLSNTKSLNDLTLISQGYKLIRNKNKFTRQVLPKYGREPNITVKQGG